MNIAIVTAGLNTKSGLRAPIELGKHLKKRGHSISFYAPKKDTDSKLASRLQKSGFRVSLIQASNPLGQSLELQRKIKTYKHDLISAHCKFPMLLGSRLSGLPIAWTYYGTQLNALSEHFFPRVPLWIRALDLFANLFIRLRTQLMVLFADSIIPISQAASRDLQKLYKQKPDATILLGSTPQNFSLHKNSKKHKKKAKSKTENQKLNLLSVSRITPYKGFHHLIKAFNQVSADFPDIKLTIVGSAPQTNYFKYLKSVAGKHIEFKLNLKDQDLIKLYQQTDIYLSADKYLFFGLPIWEASSFSIPSVAIKHQAAPEAVKHKKTGFIAKNQKQLEKYLLILLEDSSLRRKLGKNAYKLAQKHSWDYTAQTYEIAYKNLITRFYRPLISPTLISFLANKKRTNSAKLADLGSDQGTTLAIFQKLNLLKNFKQVLAVDLKTKTLKSLAKDIANLKPIQADITDIPQIPSSSIDLVTCAQVIEHIKNRKQALSEIRRILKPGGELYMSSVAKDWYGLYWHRNSQGKIVVHPDHVHEFSGLREFTDLISKSGFKIQEKKKNPGKLPLLDYLIRLNNLLSGKPSHSEHRHFYFSHPRLIFWHKLLYLPLPGYYIVEAAAVKKREL